MLQGKLDILFEEKPGYDILLAQSYRDLSGRVQAMGLSNRKICVVTDSNVAKYHLDEVVGCLAGAAGRVVTFSFPAGEERKNLDTVQELYAFLIEEGFDRNDVLAALGGGDRKSVV